MVSLHCQRKAERGRNLEGSIRLGNGGKQC